jgi:beta-1,4-mannosyl-glycoprotein beta-1,4-N-acetylglucosaminyltransferase
MLVDGFTFFNELDMLEYRLTILDDIVDYFVLVEGTKTHAGHPKLMYYSMNKERFAKWNNKIIHIVVDLKSSKPWHNERTQRRAIDQGFEQLNLKPDDIVMVSDLDEIPDPVAIKNYLNDPRPKKDVNLQQSGYYYTLEHSSGSGLSTKILPYTIYEEKYRYDCEFVRMWRAINFQEPQYIMPNAGWHFSYFGSIPFIQNKLNHFAHQDFNTPEINNEKSLRENKKNFKHPTQSIDLKYVPLKENTHLPPHLDLFLKFFPCEK